MKKFYLRTMMRTYKKQQRRHYLKKVAKSYLHEQKKFKCLIKWRQVTQEIKAKSNKLFLDMKHKRPYAAEILLEKIAYNFYLGS